MSRFSNLARVVTIMAGELFVIAAHGQQRGVAELKVVRPVKDCSSLATISLRDTVGIEVSLTAASAETPKGTFCHVTAIIAPAIPLEIDLPQDHWTQRMLQEGCGGLCGMINASIGNAGTCAPALNGEFTVATTDMSHQGQIRRARAG